MRYLDYFLSLRCSGDVLSVCSPINNTAKEITEAITVTRKIRTLTLPYPMQYNVLDLCAGNALIPVISVMYLPVKFAVAVDIKKHYRQWERVKRFEYKEYDIYDNSINSMIDSNTIITSSHPCGNLACRIVDLFLSSTAKALFLLPCCANNEEYRNHYSGNHIIQKNLSKYEQWCCCIYDKLLANKEIKTNIKHYPDCLSPKNILISAIRRENT